MLGCFAILRASGGLENHHGKICKQKTATATCVCIVIETTFLPEKAS